MCLSDDVWKYLKDRVHEQSRDEPLLNDGEKANRFCRLQAARGMLGVVRECVDIRGDRVQSQG